MPSEADSRRVGPLGPRRGPPPPATGTETDAVRARAGPAYLDKMQISFSVSPLLLFLWLALSQNPGQIRGRPLDSARAASLDFPP